MISIQLNDFSLAYPGRPLLSSIHLSMTAAQWVCLLGRSGCGKSTLLKALAGIDHGATQSGQLILRSQASAQPPTQQPAKRSAQSFATNHPTSALAAAAWTTETGIDASANVAYMAQKDALMPWLSLVENVQFPQRLKQSRSAQTVKQAYDLLDRVGLAEHAHKKPYQISGGQRQRVALARTLMIEADIVLMDEPFSALDAITRLELQALAVELLQDKTVFLITHDPIEAIRLADAIYVIREQGLTPAFIPEGTRPRFEPDRAQPPLQSALLEALL